MIKYVILEWMRGVESKNDGDWHIIKYQQLKELYNVNPFEVKIIKDFTELRMYFEIIKDCLILTPQYYSEDYNIKNCKRVKDVYLKNGIWNKEN